MMVMQPGLAWLLAGLVLLVIEVLVPGMFMMWLGAAALGTGLVTMLADLPFGQEVTLFAVFAAASIAVGLRLRGRPRRGRLNAPDSGLVGRPVRAIAFQGLEGRVRLGDSDWPARLREGASMPAPGAPMRVTAVSGTVLLVEAEPAVHPPETTIAVNGGT
jgi:inner membrane protein